MRKSASFLVAGSALLGAVEAARANDFAAVERGRYLTQAGNCQGCHTPAGEEPFAGSRPLETPFGVIYTPNITFDTDQSAVKPEFYDTLNSVALVLKEFNKTLIDVTGHTDSTGTPQHNQRLSEARAGSVADYLVAQGNNPQRFQVLGMGQNDPIASNATSEGRAQNRRVEIKIVPLT